MKLTKQLTFTLLLSLFSFLFIAQAQQTNSQTSFTIELKKGQLFTMLEPLSKKGSAEALKKYYQTAIPLAEKHGFESKGTLLNHRTLVGNYSPPGVVFATWPNKEAEQSFSDEPLWPDLKKLRPLAWEELKIFTAEVNADTVLKFDDKKHYTLAIAWFNPDRPDDYSLYLKNIEKVLLRSGGRFIYKMKNPKFEAHASDQIAPNQLTIVEWDSVDGLQQLQAKEEYQSHLALLRNGVVDFELHLLSTAALSAPISTPSKGP